MKPIIGIAVSINYRENLFQVHKSYVEAVVEAGGTPLLIAPQADKTYAAEILGRLDGLLITGGGDIDPRFFNEENAGQSKSVSAERDITELELIKLAADLDMPILGICRGCQAINVSLGGSLYQDISLKPGALNHRQDDDTPKWYPYHDITMDKESIIYDIFGQRVIGVNSFHHQAVKEIGNGLKITAVAKDDIPEVIEGTNHSFILGVQFHPERMFQNDRRFLSIFEALVVAARNREAL
ncbi:MAG: gamma-glutamyl-gamma-aminobutyrate hydrolase family protein [Thermoanaerobacteraceae bacterium]|nr:gamma-glutamyl-gamma-aminobutyrate hydrolase family protein [Thermoanaerobacteraceae bacterium]